MNTKYLFECNKIWTEEKCKEKLKIWNEKEAQEKSL